VLTLFKENDISSLLIYGPINTGKMAHLKVLCNQFLGGFEKAQTLFINSNGRFQSVGLNKRIDDFQMSHFHSKKLPKIIVFENFETLGNSNQMSMRERIGKKMTNMNFWIVTRFFTKLNQAILSRCLPVHLTFIYPNLGLIRLIEILDKENINISLEWLQYSIDFKKNTTEIFSKAFRYELYVEDKFFNKKTYFYHKKLFSFICFENSSREELIVLLRKIKTFLSMDVSFVREFFKSLDRQLYGLIPLLNL